MIYKETDKPKLSKTVKLDSRLKVFSMMMNILGSY